VITEGWHEAYGESHAEMAALRKAGDLARGATLYSNLEPCCSKGKQPPCADAIIRAGIKTVVFGARDPSNAGSKVLMEHDIEVIGRVMEAKCRRLNKGFFSLIENDRPWVTLKKAMRADGSTNGKITSEEQDAWSHQHLRGTHDAILVGSGTVINDNPQLTIRLPNPSPNPNPIRIILDPNNEIPKDATVLTDEDSDRTLVIREKLPIPELLERLKQEGVASVLVEGGPKVWKSFEENRHIDEVVILTTNQ
jgi:diaminohydroxyphosphoribosylaminopyrimidine deaminase/5-amino-6-(5-phosphoribosylamino)uracil reductase